MKTNLLVFLVLFTMTGCMTYYMTPQSLQGQLKKAQPGGQFNGITQINCVDKDGNDCVLFVSNHTGIRITRKDNTRQTFYFITAFLKDSVIIGSKSAIFSMPITPIKISDIKKIEFQR